MATSLLQLARALCDGGDPIRTWVVDGEERYALAPYMLAIGRELETEGVEQPTIEQRRERAQEYLRGAREPRDELWESILDFDAIQREAGFR